MRFETKTPAAKRGLIWARFVGFLFFAVAIGVFEHGRLAAVYVLALLGLTGLGVFNASRTPKQSKDPLDVVADATGLSFDGKRVMERSEIVRATFVPGSLGKNAVQIEGRLLRKACTVWVRDEEQARELIAALALDAPPSTAHFRALPPWAKHLRWLAVILTASPWFLVNILRLIPAWAVALIAAAYVVILVPTLLPQRVEVGQDGIFLKWLGNRRFIPFSKLDIVSKSRVGVDLILKNGQYLEIRLTQKDGGAEAEIHDLAGRIKAGIDLNRGLSRADEEAFLARSGRDVATWLREMRALGDGEASSYRAASIPRERLWTVVENRAADPSAREGAALALSATLDDDDRARILQLALKTASPRLRVALDGVGHEREEARLRVALETADELTDTPESVRAQKVGRSQS